MDYPATPRTVPTRLTDRVSYRRDAIHALLDEALVCHLGLIRDAVPQVLPTLFARVDDTVYLHLSTGSGPALALRAGAPVCVTVTALDGLVFARSQFHHSANYRSVVCYGTPRLVTDEIEKRDALRALVDKVAAGRSGDSRPPDRKELAQTAVLAVSLAEVTLKQRTGDPEDDAADLDLPHWAGVLPLRQRAGRARPGTGVRVPVPGYLRSWPAGTAHSGATADASGGDAWLAPVVLRGRHVALEPLDLCHVADLFTACDHPEVYQHVPGGRPADPAALAAWVEQALEMAHAGTRVPWVQRDTRTGRVIGTTSYAEVDPGSRSVGIGYSRLGRPWWRTGVNTESKLMLMRRAFEDLGAVRVHLQTDIRNTRSQTAIERLGATREGVLRKHRLRADGTWRDSVLYAITDDQWPAVRGRLTTRLAAG